MTRAAASEQRKRKQWDAASDEVVRSGYLAGTKARDIALIVGATADAVRIRAIKLGVPHRRQSRGIEQRFLDYVLPEPNSGCWLWTGSVDKRGYAQIRVPYKDRTRVLRYASNVALELYATPLLPGQGACHRCDNPYCVNPDHLFGGTQLENIRDCMAKGRKTPPPKTVAGRHPPKDICRRGHVRTLTPSGRYKCNECFNAQRRVQRAGFIAAGLTIRGLPRKVPLSCEG